MYHIFIHFGCTACGIYGVNDDFPRYSPLVRFSTDTAMYFELVQNEILNSLGPILYCYKTKQLFIFDGLQTVIVLVLPHSSFEKGETLGRFAYVNLRAKKQ